MPAKRPAELREVMTEMSRAKTFEQMMVKFSCGSNDGDNFDKRLCTSLGIKEGKIKVYNFDSCSDRCYISLDDLKLHDDIIYGAFGRKLI